MKRLLAILLSLTLTLSMVPTAWADEGNTSPTSGYCGGDTEAESYSYLWQGVSSEHDTQTVYKNIVWELIPNGSNDTGTTYRLVLTGEGPMFDFTQNWMTGVGAETNEPWWNWRSQITEVEIAEGITTIGKLGFYALALESITIPDSVTSIGESAVADNKHLESVVIGAGVRTIKSTAFNRASALKTLTFKNGADVVIGQDAFYDSAIENLTIPSRVREIDYRAFGENRGENNENPTFLKTVTFEENTSLTLKNAIFDGCASLTDADMSSLDCDSSQMGAVFIGCTALENVKLPTSSHFTKLPEQMFSGCISLKTVVIPANIIAWGNQVFNASGVHTLVFETTNMADELGVNFVANDQANKVIIYTQKAEDAGFQKTGQGKSGLYGKNKQINAVTNGGAFPADTVFTEGVLATPVRGNYTFDGWYSDAAFTENKKLADSAAPAVDTIYYAKWVSTIAFDANGGELPTGTTNPAVVNEGSAIGTLPTPTRTSYTFVGWNTAADGSGKFVTASDTPTGDMTLYAVWGTTAADSGYTILPIEDQTYTGQPLTPAVYMVDTSKNRIAATGVSYENNTNAGTATAKVTLGGTEYTVTFTIVPKLIAKPTADTTEFIYTGSEQTYTVAESADYIVSNNTRTNAGSQTVTVALTDKSNTKWTDNTTNDVTFTFTIGKATPVISLSADRTTLYGGGTIKLTVSDAPQEGTVNVTCDVDDINIVDNGDGTFSATLPNETKTYAFTAAYTAAADGNYTDASPAPCTVSVTRYVPSAPGSSVTVPATSNGSVTVSPSTASKGTTVTVTTKPNEGYELGSLEVLDKNGNALALKDLGNGKYSFTMPDGKVTVNANFVKASVSTGFADVPANAYYADAVKWAVDKGVTNGLSDTLFGPYEPCTRAQIVTFLWRAAGSPEPKATTSKMTDLDPNAYYYKAVLWAVENGITSGMTDTTFAPNATCTRGQSVTFLYRALGKKASSSANFSDVAANAFYADAVNWAVENNVTNGTSATTFSPNADCTRAEIVTFLYRAYQGK